MIIVKKEKDSNHVLVFPSLENNAEARCYNL